jgi:hypothetical protein
MENKTKGAMMLEGIYSFFRDFNHSARKPPSLAHFQSQNQLMRMEIVTQVFETLSPLAIIPGKTAQLFNSGRALLSGHLNSSEMVVQSLQAMLCSTQVALSLYMLIQGQSKCEDLETMTCRLMLASKLLYDGVLLTGWVPAEQLSPQMDAPSKSN